MKNCPPDDRSARKAVCEELLHELHPIDGPAPVLALPGRGSRGSEQFAYALRLRSATLFVAKPQPSAISWVIKLLAMINWTTVNPSPETQILLQLIGGPTAIFEFAGLRLITDPTFDEPTAPEPGNATPGKVSGPACAVSELGSIDVVLLSHDQHPDNLDGAGRQLLPHVPLVITTVEGAGRLEATTMGLSPWETREIAGGVRVTGVPAQHGPGAQAEEISGPVIGFLLRSADGRSIYVSGDNVEVDIPRQIRRRFGAPTVAILFGGGASVPFLFDGAYVTMTNQTLLESAIALDAGSVVPLHTEGWSHYTENRDELAELFSRAGIGDRLHVLAPGQHVQLND